MPVFFKDTSEDIQFEYCDVLPNHTMVLRIKGENSYKLNVKAFHLYGMYRNSIYDSYKQKPDLAKDIKERKNEYQEKTDSKLSKAALYKDPLHHYSIAASLGAMQEWKDPKEKMQCYIAYQNKNGHKSKIGFVHFKKHVVDGKPVIYIAQAGVLSRGQSIGRRLMECVLSHYPAGTKFYILTRVFNTEAENLYKKRLGFKPIAEDQIKQLGYDNRYCGFKHTTTDEEVQIIKAKQTNTKLESKLISSSGNDKDEQKHNNQAISKANTNKSSNSNSVKWGLFAATVAAAGIVCYKIFTNESSSSTPKLRL